MTANEVQMVVAETLRQLGIDPGEITDRQARKRYGKWFSEAVAAGHIKPIRVGVGKTSTKHYRILDILAYKDKCYQPAKLIYKNY